MARVFVVEIRRGDSVGAQRIQRIRLGTDIEHSLVRSQQPTTPERLTSLRFFFRNERSTRCSISFWHAVPTIQASLEYRSIFRWLIKFKMVHWTICGVQHAQTGWGRPFCQVISLNALKANINFLSGQFAARNAHQLKVKVLNVSCSAASTETGAERAEWPPLEGRFTYRQLRALQVSERWHIKYAHWLHNKHLKMKNQGMQMGIEHLFNNSILMQVDNLRAELERRGLATIGYRTQLAGSTF